MTAQQGSGALMMVILLLLMSAALLQATRRQMEQSLSLVVDEGGYLQQTSLAVSALRWGETERWPSVQRWSCRTANQSAWRACFIVLKTGGALLRGDSGSGTLAIYRWVKRNDENSAISALPHGWLDYCPLASEESCLPEGQAAGL